MEVAVSPFSTKPHIVGLYLRSVLIEIYREEEDPDDYPFPLNLRSPMKATGPTSPVDGILNGPLRVS